MRSAKTKEKLQSMVKFPAHMRIPFLSLSADSLCLFFLLFLCFVRFPVILRRFHLNPGTGGNGFHRGGDGVIRELLFRRTQVLSVLSERRAFRPYGMSGMTVFFFVCLYSPFLVIYPTF